MGSLYLQFVKYANKNSLFIWIESVNLGIFCIWICNKLFQRLSLFAVLVFVVLTIHGLNNRKQRVKTALLRLVYAQNVDFCFIIWVWSLPLWIACMQRYCFRKCLCALRRGKLIFIQNIKWHCKNSRFSWSNSHFDESIL